MELFLIYIWLKLDSIIPVFGISTVLLLACALICGLHCTFEDLWNVSQVPEHRRRAAASSVSLFKRLFIGGICTLVLAIGLPSSKDVAVLAGSYFGMQVVKSEEAQKVWTLMRGKANELLDEEIKKLKPKQNVPAN